VTQILQNNIAPNFRVAMKTLISTATYAPDRSDKWKTFIKDNPPFIEEFADYIYKIWLEEEYIKPQILATISALQQDVMLRIADVILNKNIPLEEDTNRTLVSGFKQL